MHSIRSVLIFLTVFAAFVHLASAQQQDKTQSKLYMEQADLVMQDTKAMDDARDIMVIAADFDTTNVPANFEAGHMHLATIKKDFAVKYFLRIYRQNPDYRFDLMYWIGQAYQYGLDFDNAINFYSRYREKLMKNPDYQGKNKVELKDVERRLTECKNGKEFVARPKNYAIVNMGKEINSEFDDYGPVFSENENEIIFTTRRRDGNTYENVAQDNKPYEDIFTTTKSGGVWAKSKNIGSPVNTKFNDSNLALSPDGNTLFLYKDNGNGDIYFSQRRNDGSWGAPEALPGLINSTFRESSISITKEGDRLYFASERPGGYGGSDIYVCTKDEKGEWSRVKNLGPVINTESDEDAPFIDYNGKTLYFSSQGGKGMGGFDIFKSTLVNAEKDEWGAPENLGYPINTPDDDVFFVSTKDGKRGYYASVRDDGIGYSDIYVITIPEEKKKDPVVAKDPAPVRPRMYIVVVVDAENHSPLEAKVKLLGVKDKMVMGRVNKGKGTYEFSITAADAKDYQLSVEREGYAFVNQPVRIEGTSGDSDPTVNTIEMKKLAVGVSKVLKNIYFDFAKASFKEESYTELNKLESMMRQNGSMRVEIAGHTDDIGTKDFNKQLSQRRADAVRSFLTSRGIDPRRVAAMGYGEEKPLSSNDDEKEGRELNRRVEFKVLGN